MKDFKEYMVHLFDEEFDSITYSQKQEFIDLDKQSILILKKELHEI